MTKPFAQRAGLLERPGADALLKDVVENADDRLKMAGDIIDFDHDIKKAVDAASMHLPKFGITGAATQQVFAGDFSDELIDGVKKMGLRIEVVPNNLTSRAPRGYVVGATIDPASGQRQAVSSKILNASALGQE